MVLANYKASRLNLGVVPLSVGGILHVHCMLKGDKNTCTEAENIDLLSSMQIIGMDLQLSLQYVNAMLLCFLKERDSLQSKVEELEEMLEAEKERQQKKTEEISSDEDAEHAKHMAEESLMMHIEALQEENETLRYWMK